MKILLSTDGSEFSKAAIDFCQKIVTNPENTSLKIISVFEQPMPIAAEPFAMSAEYYDEMAKAGLKQSEQFAGQAKTQVISAFSDTLLELSAEVITGSPPQVIVEKAKEWGADLIVVGSHGYGFWSRTLLGSVSNSIVHHAPCSVLVVRANKTKLSG